MKEYEVYNLQFPSHCKEMEIFGYKFKRVEEYPTIILELNQPVEIHSEFHIKPNTGNHTITAKVELPEKQKKFVLEWGGTTENWALHDIMLLLSLFTQRNVFWKQPKEEGIIIRDPRMYGYGGSLRSSLKQEFESIEGTKNQVDRGFERNLTEIYKLIRTPNWSGKYEKGFFLFLLKSAFQAQILETSFILCWVIWEHLYSNMKRNRDITKIGSGETSKVSSLLYKFDFGTEEECLNLTEIFKKTRDSLVHFGAFEQINCENIKLFYNNTFVQNNYSEIQKNAKSIDDAILFIYLTELLTSKILGLNVNDIYNVLTNLEKRLVE